MARRQILSPRVEPAAGSSGIEDLLRKEFSPLSPELESRLVHINTKEDLSDLAKTAAPFLDVGVASRLAFISQLCDAADSDLEIVRLITKDGSIATIRDVATKYHRLGLSRFSSTAGNVDPERLEKLRAILLALDPTGMVYGLVDSNVFPADLETRTRCLQILDIALSANLNISTDSFRGILRDDEKMSVVQEDQRQPVKDLLATLQRLQALVADPDDIPGLLKCSFTSARSIARTPKETFITNAGSTGISSESATRIHNQASVVNVRNEHIWTSLLRARNEVPLGGTGASRMAAMSEELTASEDLPTDGTINLSTLFKDIIQSTECSDCASITGPAAYYVDILQQLQSWQTDPLTSGSPSLLDKLFERRPDLGDLQLSCANTNVLIPYIDLVNEALESVVASKSPVITKTYNMGDSDNSDDCIAEPQNVSYDVYQKAIQPMVFPLATFPYNQAIDSVRSYLEALGSSRHGILTALRSEYRVALHGPSSAAPNVKDLAAVVLDRATAAESIGLLQEDYIAITHEAFQTAEFLQAKDVDEYHSKIGLQAVSAYWGYQSDETMVSKTEDGLGLCFVKGQFLPRASITFQQLLDFLNTRFVAKRLVIEMPDGAAKFSGAVADMRLRQVKNDGSTGPLEVKMCDDMQAFLRVWRVLGWSMGDADAAVVTLAGTRTSGVDADVIDGLAHVKELVDLASGTSVSRLLPLWGDIDTNGPNSLYAQVFLQNRLVRKDPVFLPDADGNYLATPGLKFADHMPVVLAALGLTEPAFDAIQKAANVGDSLSLRSISLVYRVSLFCNLLQISPPQYADFLSLYPSALNPYENPRQSLKLVQQFGQLGTAGWSLEQLLFITRGAPSADTLLAYFSPSDVVAATIATISSNTSLRQAVKNAVSSFSIGDASPADIAAKLAQLAILQILKPSFTDLDPEVMNYMLSDVITVAEGKSGISALATLRQPDITSAPFDGHFIPPTTDAYVFTSSLKDKPEMSIDGVAVDFSNNGDVWKSTKARRLLNAQSYSFYFKGNLSTDLKWETSVTQLAPFTPQMVIDGPSVSTTTDVFIKLSKIAHLGSVSGLRLEEVHYFQEYADGFDFNSFTYDNIQALRTYTDLRDSFPLPKNAPFPLLDLYKWLAQPDDPKNLASQLSVVSGWANNQVQGVLDAHYPGVVPAALVGIFQDVRALDSLNTAMRAIVNLNIPSAAPEMLYTVAEPVVPPVAVQDFDNAMKLRVALHSHEAQLGGAALLAANNRLRENQRGSLIGYLLQQDFIRNKGLTDADGLYKHFLIDVQMGSVLQTSRLKQAISVIQLFVQRCTLGEEKDYGVPSTSVNRDNWDYMLRYRLWEANRKAFLYAESWIDPTLRDDKTEQFNALESFVLQSKLTVDSVNDAIKEYLYAADEVADLEVITYLWERRNLKGDHGSFHFFGRTRAAPYRYYYRRMDLKGPKTDQVVYWKPWTKMEVDIQAQDVDSNGNKLAKPGTYLVPALFRGRLYLFVPQITLKTVKSTENKNKSFQAIGNDDTAKQESVRVWEMKMGWSEYRNGKWSKKQVSQTTLEIGAATLNDPAVKGTDPPADKWVYATAFPDISSFRFWVRERTATVPGVPDPVTIPVIEVERCVGPWPISDSDLSNYTAYPLGQFELRGQRLVLVDADPSHTWKSTIPSSFMRLAWQVAANNKDPVPQNVINHGLNKRPLLTVTDTPPVDSEYTWTLSFDEDNYNRATGFMVDVSTDHGAQSLFGFPPYIPDNITKDPEYDDTMETAVFHNVVSPLLLETATLTDGLTNIYQAVSKLPEELYFDGFGKRNSDIYHEQANPYAIYTWETSVHAVSLLMERLQSTQQYDLALNIARCAFDPTIDGTAVERCWLFPPFRDPNVRDQSPPTPDKTWEDKLAMAEWMANRASVHAAARGRPVAYMKRLAMKYIEILVGAGDDFFRQNTLETIPLAMQRYVEASRIFGPTPLQAPALGRRTVKSYNDLAKQLDTFSNAIVDLELDFPFHCNPATRGTTTATNATATPFIETGYFCVPSNPQVLALRDLIDDRLYKIRNCMDINGKLQRLPLFEPPIDPGALLRAGAAGLSPSAFAGDIDSPMPNYRFRYLLERAYEFCNELKSMDLAVLSAREKKDAEALSALTTRHTLSVQTMIMDTKTMQKAEALKAIETLQETRKMHETRLSYYLALTGDKSKQIPDPDSEWEDIPQTIEVPTTDDLRMTSNEKLDMDASISAMATGQLAATLDNVAAELLIMPQLTINAQPLGVGISTEIGTGIVARALQATSGWYKQNAQLQQEGGLLASKKAQLIRQLQERRQAANQAGREIKTVDTQIATQQARVALCDAEIAAQQKEIDNTMEVQEWLRDKYTSVQLYAWLENRYSSLFHDTYRMASELAQKVQRAYRFEHPTDSTAYLKTDGGGYWDSNRDGMLCAESLNLDLKKIEMSYINSSPYDFEIIKTVSLRQLDPWALLNLRRKGATQFALPEVISHALRLYLHFPLTTIDPLRHRLPRPLLPPPTSLHPLSPLPSGAIHPAQHNPQACLQHHSHLLLLLLPIPSPTPRRSPIPH
jgi:hypothetical protein